MESGKWEEIIFTQEDIRTDSLLYGEKSYLLLPPDGQENRFLAISSHTSRRFFIYSTSQGGLERLHAFFFRLYGAMFEESAPPDVFSSHTVLTNARRDRRISDFYHPRFVRNIMDLSAVDSDITTAYSVALRKRTGRRGRRGYNFVASLSFRNPEEMDAFRDVLREEIRALRMETGWKIATKPRGRVSNSLMRNTFQLINFIRIPAESDFII
ncbi:MAG: hypothetical protein M1285_02345 [Candidatus Thermoplasmatota archaeon]|jgi:hypothetical protein|nr:hypothetical protein [Candidatus Thermoplasmatota archaeon]